MKCLSAVQFLKQTWQINPSYPSHDSSRKYPDFSVPDRRMYSLNVLVCGIHGVECSRQVFARQRLARLGAEDVNYCGYWVNILALALERRKDIVGLEGVDRSLDEVQHF